MKPPGVKNAIGEEAPGLNTLPGWYQAPHGWGGPERRSSGAATSVCAGPVAGRRPATRAHATTPAARRGRVGFEAVGVMAWGTSFGAGGSLPVSIDRPPPGD